MSKAIELANKKINPETAEQVMSDVEQASDVQDGVDDTNV